jgi:hypothetical protein
MPKAFCSNAGLPGSFTKALSYDEQIQFLIDKYNKMADVINNLKINTDVLNTVKYTPQTGFSELQKQQATENIGAVSTIANQILNEDEQMNARENINAMEYEAKDDFVKAGGAVVYDENFTNILPNTNLATITYCEPGRYYCADITGITGFSAAMPFEMEVFKVNSNLVRRYFQYDNGRKYVQEVELNPLKFYSVVDFGGFNVSYLLQDLTEEQKEQARNNIGAGTSNITSGDISTQINNNSVKFSGAQNLTNAQKAQARNNIGAGTSSITSNDINTQIDNNCVKFNSAQNLTEEQKTLARNNIGVVSTVTDIFNSVYPIGSIYITVNNTNPGTIFTGTWEQITDKFLLAAGEKYNAGSTGGEATHKLTVAEMPPHRHSINVRGFITATAREAFTNTSYSYSTTPTDCGIADTMINENGGGESHNNMPPYLAVYVWKRIS